MKVETQKEQSTPKLKELKAKEEKEVKVETKPVEKKEAKVKASSTKASKAKASKEEIAESSAKVQDEIMGLTENFSWEDIADAISSLDFFVDHRSDDCAEKSCENLRTTQQFCRLHYIANWYDIKRKREILKEGRLQEYIEELISKYPPKYIESILGDLQDDKDFFKALNELNIVTEFDFEEDPDSGESDEEDDDIEVETRSFAPTKSRFDDD